MWAVLAALDQAGSTKVSGPNFADWNPFEEASELRYVWDRIPAGGITLLVADSGIGKSLFAQQLSLSIAKCQPSVLNSTLNTTTNHVIYVDLEGHNAGTKQRLTQMGLEEMDLERLHIKRPHGFRIEEHADLLVGEVERLQPDLVVIDSFAASHRLMENEHAAMQCYFDDHLRQITNASANTAVLLLAHTNKSEGSKVAEATDWHQKIRGSTAIWAAVDAVYCLGHTRNSKFSLLNEKAKDSATSTHRTLSIDIKSGGFVIDEDSAKRSEGLIRVPDLHPSLPGGTQTNRTPTKRI